MLGYLPFLAKGAPAGEQVTFGRDIAPLFQRHCTNCHRAGAIGPMPLLSYEDARPWAKSIREQVLLKKMPPWKPEPGFGEFLGAHVLSEAEIDLVRRWVDLGAQRGTEAVAAPVEEPRPEWQLGKPDMVVSMPRAFSIPADGPDIYRCFVTSLGVPADRYIVGYEFKPGNPKVLHHAILYLDRSGAAKKMDGVDGSPGYKSFGGPGFFPESALGGWSPGSSPTVLPRGSAKLLRPGSDLVIQTHYHPSGKPEVDQSSLAVYFGKKPPDKLVITVPILQKNFMIPAAAARHPVRATFTLPMALEVIALTPHMHDLGREMKVTAELPNGSNLPLIWIRDWDFNWQNDYYLRTPARLPAGSKITMQAWFDNTANNPKNPFHPPRPIVWGEGSVDEMALCFVQAVVDRDADLRPLWLAIVRQPGLGSGGW